MQKKKLKFWLKRSLFAFVAATAITNCQSVPPREISEWSLPEPPPNWDFDRIRDPAQEKENTSSKLENPFSHPAQLKLEQFKASYEKLVDRLFTRYQVVFDREIKKGQSDDNATEEAAKVLGIHLSAIEDIYFYAQEMLLRFDDQLFKAQKEKDPLKSAEYNKLQKARMIKERVTAQVVYQIVSLLYYEAGHGSSFQQSAAHQMLTHSRKIWNWIGTDNLDPEAEKYRHGNWLRKLIFQDLFVEVKKHVLQAVVQIKSDQWPQGVKQIIAVLDSLIISDSQALNALVVKVRSLKQNALQNTEAIEHAVWVHRAAELFQEIELAQDPSKSPRKPNLIQPICPSSGSSGNITGSQFPKGTWAITLDDGPNPKFTPIIEAAFGLPHKGSFFWLSQLTPTYKKIVAAVQGKGHTVANHSSTHAFLPKLSVENLNREINKSTEIDLAIYMNGAPKFFRCPYGACGAPGGPIRKMIAEKNLVHVFWSVDSLDWQDRDPQSIVKRVKAQFDRIKEKSGGIILFHDIHPQSAQAVQQIVPILVQSQVKLQSLSEIVKDLNAGLGSCPSGWTP